MGPGKDTHSTPVPTEWGGRGWPKRTTRRSKTRGLPSSMVAEHVTTNHSAHDKMLKESPKDKPNNKLEQNKITKFSKEQDVKFKEQESSGLKKSAGELTSDRDSANAELSAVVQYTELNDSDVDKTTMYRDESEHRRNSHSIEQVSSRNKSWRHVKLCVPQQRTVEQIVDGTMPQVYEQIDEVVEVFPQDRISERNVEQIVEVVYSISMEVESAQMERIRGTSR